MKQYIKDLHSDGLMPSWSRWVGTYVILLGTLLVLCGILLKTTDYITQGVLLVITALGLKTINSSFTERGGK